ncbi:hypothetical protein EJ06DRAFT_582232 [Trichodelitschia bisporula]|uniref:DUF676 domain-containing protein n=1 Tax=Trichodelitschia bisporula TaxID=703511 RepID=A0A6G1HWZ3_9PEZI|nr:hypothetical protein EJ06DRAFT_582232 [Trichodelitschia bisporula]
MPSDVNSDSTSPELRARAPVGPPPLPPRTSVDSLAPPPYDNHSYGHNHPAGSGPYSAYAAASHDPRSSSTQSLVPSPHSERRGRRRLLLVYIHGFMGDETSFKSFPAHVHNIVSITLAESHVVHTKIYPKYRSRQNLQIVSEDFSRWFAPHESPDTDVILLGHSMGGLLAAEIVLLRPYGQTTGSELRHRIIGVINFDVPFLGIHPGVISSGLGSLFKPAPEPPGLDPLALGDLSSPSMTTLSSAGESVSSPTSSVGRHDTLFSLPSDPNFNPRFSNDIALPVRKGWQSALHFMTKHSDGLRQATKKYVQSHIEFGGAMADYPGLKARYLKIRKLEEEEADWRRGALGDNDVPSRVRFLNYYTACTGRPKRPKPPAQSEFDSGAHQPSAPTVGLATEGNVAATSSTSLVEPTSKSPRISVEEYRDNGSIEPKEPEEEATSLRSASPRPMDDDDSSAPERIVSRIPSEDGIHKTSPPDVAPQPSPRYSLVPEPSLLQDVQITLPTLPPIPPEPTPPPPLDLSPYPDKAAQKIATKEHERLVKAWKQARKDRESAIKDRAKLEEKMKKAAAKEKAQKEKAEALEKTRAEDNAAKVNELASSADVAPVLSQMSAGEAARGESDLTAPGEPGNSGQQVGHEETRARPGLPSPLPSSQGASRPADRKRDKKFCMLPPKDAAGNLDQTWVRVFMEGVDEVGAHTGLFFLSDTYERLVGDVADKIEDWVIEDMSRRYMEEMD